MGYNHSSLIHPSTINIQLNLLILFHHQKNIRFIYEVIKLVLLIHIALLHVVLSLCWGGVCRVINYVLQIMQHYSFYNQFQGFQNSSQHRASLLYSFFSVPFSHWLWCYCYCYCYAIVMLLLQQASREANALPT